MKTDRHKPPRRVAAVKHAAALFPRLCSIALVVCFLAVPASRSAADDSLDRQDAPSVSQDASTDVGNASPAEPPEAIQRSHPQAVQLLRRVLDSIVHGPAFDAKVRETVWTTGRTVVGVGTYEQAGGGSGRFNLQLTMHDGDGKHRLQQISDGRLAWTRSEIAGKVSLRRVDVGRLDQWVRGATGSMRVSPGMRVGGWAEMLSTIERDYLLRVDGATLEDEPVWVVVGMLRKERREQILADSQRKRWPVLCPTGVRVAVRKEAHPEFGFGRLLPIRMEYWSDGGRAPDDASERDLGHLVTLIELYSIRPIQPPPPERFRFENLDAEVNFANETDKYIELYGVSLTERQRRQLRR